MDGTPKSSGQARGPTRCTSLTRRTCARLLAALPVLMIAAQLTSTTALASSVPGVTPARLAPDALYEGALHDVLSAAAPELLEGDGALPPGDRELFQRIVTSAAFESAAVGPFDVHVYRAGELAKQVSARSVLEAATHGLEKLVPVMDRYFDREQGLVSGRRFPIVIAQDGDVLKGGFGQIVALLDHCEADYSNWTRDNGTLWKRETLDGVVVRTWEVQVFNLAHNEARDAGSTFLEHGVGYYTIAHLVNRVLRLGSWGTVVPPWLSDGLIDELDIQAYGEAWVGGDWYTEETEGWFRPGWSGFLPEGTQPPPPPSGPPADLAVKVTKTGDMWAHRSNSPERHWNELVADRTSEAPASFQYMADHESFLPRDRALARCAMHLLLDVAAPEKDETFLAMLDHEVSTPEHGMPDADPLPLVFARAIGGVPEVEAYEALPLAEAMAVIGHPEIAERLRELGASGMAAVADHRQQSAWLYDQWEMESEERLAVWTEILGAEYFQQLHEWKLVSGALDRVTGAGLEAAKSYPSKERARLRVAEAYWGAASPGS